jgi:hypothetical protein
LRIVLEAKCGLCGKKQHVTATELTDQDVNGKATLLVCTHCNNKLADSEHLKALGGFLSAVQHKRKHIAPAFHAAKILMGVLERHYPWKFRICVLAEVKKRTTRKPLEEPAAVAEEIKYTA